MSTAAQARSEIAERLDGVRYPDIPRDVIEAARQKGVVILHGMSDDYVVLSGAFSDEAYGNFRLTRKGLLTGLGATLDSATDYNSVHGDEDLRPLEMVQAWKRNFDASAVIRSDYGETGWVLGTDVPHSTFRIMDDDDLHSLGLVIAVEELPVLTELSS